jgi:hypothetical protein
MALEPYGAVVGSAASERGADVLETVCSDMCRSKKKGKHNEREALVVKRRRMGPASPEGRPRLTTGKSW